MSDVNQDTSRADAGIDLTQFYQVFFEEAGENLDSMEKMLLELHIEAADDEELNAIFRCAHSVKGGAATFGFADVAELTHQMEALLDKLRRHELVLTAPMVDVLLASGDSLRSLLARHQGTATESVDTSELVASLRSMCAGGDAVQAAPAQVAAPAPAAVAPAPAPAQAAAQAPGKPGMRVLELVVTDLARPEVADSIVELFKEITDLGEIEALDGGTAPEGRRRFRIITGSADSDLLDLFTFHVPRESVQLTPMGESHGFHEGAPGAPPVEPPAAAYGFFDSNPGAPVATGGTAPSAPAQPPAAARPAGASKDAAPAAKAGGANLDSATLRVSIDKVDQLINLVGELVITQAMLAQNSKGLDAGLHQQLTSGLTDLERNTRDLQEAVMSIRMIPMSMVFNRFPRMLRDLAQRLGKQVDLVTIGEATELDKGMVEKITDPLTHLVRNSCDHGIELPADRIARGKPERGTITLVASHQGGSIVIEVRDNGRGLSREKLLKKARERGIDAPDTMTDSEVWSLIFAPGFSTADVVTDVSGRGVGMDVVKKNIVALGGSVEIDSAEGHGMSVRVRLPLTLAIMDGMSVGVGHECYILPLGSVLESFQLKDGMVKTVGSTGRVVEVRGEFMPVIDLEQVFGIPRDADAPPSDIMVVVESEGGRVALLVEELLGQQQVVVKNLEANYRKVPDVSGATILGDGRVALILDISTLVRRSRH